MQNNNVWKPIVGYEDLYLVSNTGDVKKVDGKLLKQSNRGSYKAVTLIKDKQEKLINVHRLVGEAFIVNPYNLPQINHKDEDKYNNNVDNLEWCTAFYNIHYGNRSEKSSDKQRKKICSISETGDIVNIYKGINDTKLYGYTPQAVSECCRGIRKIHKSYMWRFYD